MTINQTIGDYELITDEHAGAQLEIRYIPDGSSIRINQGVVEDTNNDQVLGTRQSSVGSLTDSTGGSTDGTLAAVSGSGADSAINNNFAELNAKIDAILTAIGTSGHGLTGD